MNSLAMPPRLKKAPLQGPYMTEGGDASEHLIDMEELNDIELINNSQWEVKRDFLNGSINYLQDRLNFVNDKANILIAIQTGLFIGIVWILGTFFLPSVQQGVTKETIAVYAFLIVNFSFVVVIIALLLRTIRPSKTYLSLFTGIDRIKTTGVMWPRSNVAGPEKFVKRVESMSEYEIYVELIGTVYALQQLVNQTYKYYRMAVLLMKIQIFVVPVGFLALVFQMYP